MNSFTKKLVLNCTGTIFISFLVVYFLFNVLVSNYIRAEAERELSSGMQDVVSLTYTLPSVQIAPGMVFSGVRITDDVPLSIQQGRFEIQIVAGTERPENFSYQTITVPRDVILPIRPEGFWASPFREIYNERVEVHGFVPYTQTHINAFTMDGGHISLHPIRQHSMVNADVIIVSGNGEIITPRLETLSSTQRAEVEFLVEYYRTNLARFAATDMVRVSNTNSTYYVSSSRQNLSPSQFSILMYTDISPAMVFTNTMNRILGLLLVLSGLLSLAISIVMSTRFKRAIVRLCGYADAIGRGNWEEKAGVFKDTEFNQLSKSMDNMSNMLQAYESNQKQFFQNVSHELRTPLMSIQGYAEGILEDIFTKEEAAGIILTEGQKMAGLVGELLYVSRIDSGEETSKTLIDVQNLLNECCERIRSIAQKSDKQVSLEALPQEITVEANEENLERAILNILSNAIRHANSDVEISCKTTGKNLEIVICDDGNGINNEDLPHIFERFYKGENGNYGLGLAISRDIIKSLHGNIFAENLPAPKTGAVFTIILPYIERQDK